MGALCCGFQNGAIPSVVVEVLDMERRVIFSKHFDTEFLRGVVAQSEII